jgi:hypothetical protein
VKPLRTITLLILIVISFFSCKKSDEAINWKEELKGTAWSGEFKYTKNADYIDLQPFSIILNNDGTLTWSDIQSTRLGGNWAVEGTKVTITFPNKTSLTADVSKDKWSNFTSVDIGFQIVNMANSSIPKQTALENTTWQGKMNGSDITVKFLTEMKVQFTTPVVVMNGHIGSVVNTKKASNIYETTYSISGAGIKTQGPTEKFNSYCIFLNNATMMKVVSLYYTPLENLPLYFPWEPIKQ